LGHLQMEFLEDHRPLADGVFETVYSNGERLIVNYGEKAFSMEGQTVPAKGFVLLKP